MKWILILVYIAGFVLAEGEVLVLTDNNCEETINLGKPVFIKFYAPWCGHCQRLAPDYIKLAEEVKKNGDNFTIAELDATANKRMATKFSIQGFPTLILFVNGMQIEYEGDRQIEDMFKFIKDNSKIILKPLNSLEKITEKIAEIGNRCILVSNKKEDVIAYLNVSVSVKEFDFTYTTPELGNQQFPETNGSCVVILRDFDAKKILYCEPLEIERFKEFLIKLSKPIVANFDIMTSLEILEKKDRKVVMLAIQNEANTQYIEIFKAAAKSNKSPDFMFAMLKNESDWDLKLFKYFRLKAKDTPRIEIVDFTVLNNSEKDRPKRYLFESQLDAGNIAKFIKDFNKGSLVPLIEPEPEIEITFAIAADNTTFKDEVINNKKDVFVMFYSQWCVHCQRFGRVYEKIAEEYKEKKYIKFVKVDIIHNKIKGIKIDVYPTIYLYRLGKKKTPVIYHDELLRENFLSFVSEYTDTSKMFNKEDL